MTPFEEELKQALQRQEPPGDFTARVLARCAREDAKKQNDLWHRFWTTPAWRLGVVAAALVVVAGGTAYEQRYVQQVREAQREVRGMEAKRKLILAMRIAGTKLQEVQQRVKESEQIEQ
jgi:anti-sigma-K factor RskA